MTYGMQTETENGLNMKRVTAAWFRSWSMQKEGSMKSAPVVSGRFIAPVIGVEPPVIGVDPPLLA